MSGCKRVWEAEAARDGRLSREDRAQFERHAQSCAECAREQLALDELARGLRELQVVDADELSLRRRRQELLARANAERMAAPLERSLVRRRPVLLALTGVLVAAALGLFALRDNAADERGLVLAVEAERGASYRRASDDGIPIITLEHGRLSLKVQRGTAEHGVRIRTPDGLIEDVGTTFSVSVESGRTELVEVSEGQVLVSLNGRPTRLVNAGEVHRPYGDGSARTESASTVPREVPPDAAVRAPVHEAHAKHAHVARRSGEPSEDASHGSHAERQFAAAVSTLEAGDAAEAALQFFRFEQAHRDHALAEDASYLRIVALMRAGLSDEARASGRAYLSHYPHGFRRPDVERLLAP